MPKAKLTELHNEIDKMLSEGMALWEKYLKAPIPEEYRYFGADEVAENYDGRHIIDLAAACQCFFYFRYLHSDMESESDIRTLLGDYFFSRFSLSLIPIDSTELIDEFAAFLNEDTQSEPYRLDLAKLAAFFGRVNNVLYE